MSLKTFVTSRIAAFGHAFRGWWHVLRTQHNAWIHSVFATVVILMGLWVGLKPLDWAVIVLTIAMVFTAEFINTAIEAVVDKVSPEFHELAGRAKDMGSAAVFLLLMMVVLSWALILGPRLLG